MIVKAWYAVFDLGWGDYDIRFYESEQSRDDDILYEDSPCIIKGEKDFDSSEYPCCSK